MNNENTLSVPNIRKLIVLPLFAALIAVGSYIIIPVGLIPIALQNFFIVLSGLVLGPAAGAASVCLFLLMGIIGLPVFVGGTGGIAHFAAPSAGFLFSYPFTAFIAGVLSRPRKSADTETADSGARKKSGFAPRLKDLAAALTAGFLVTYAIGLTWLKIRMGFDWPKTFAAGLLPFIPGDLFKFIAAAILAPRLRAIFRTEGIGAGK